MAEGCLERSWELPLSCAPGRHWPGPRAGLGWAGLVWSPRHGRDFSFPSVSKSITFLKPVLPFTQASLHETKGAAHPRSWIRGVTHPPLKNTRDRLRGPTAA